MASEWSNGRLGDCVLLQSGGTPSKSRPDFWMGDIPWVSAKDMKSYWIEDTEDHLSETGANKAARIVEEKTTLLLVRGMTLHNDIPICRVRRSAAFNQDVKAVLARSGIDREFVPYLLLGNKAKLLSIVDSAGHGTGRLNSDTLLNLPVCIPPAGEQRAIAHILGSLDDKIELNRRMNETLEEMARALFKSWFVDFDPVRARMEGRQPAGMDEETAALFPDLFEGSALGQIPKGWRAGSLGDIADNIRRGVDPAEVSSTTPYIGLDHMPRKSIALSEWGEAGQVASNKFEFLQGEVLFGKLRPYFHKVGVAAIDGVCSTDILVVAPRLPLWYGLTLCHLSSIELVNHADATSTGTKMPRAKWSDLALFPITIPPEEVAESFTEKVRPLVERIQVNIHQSRTLAAIRDALLPKLLSGEVRVGEAEEVVEEAL
jgi:type I restriction enzyme S subunit